MNFIALHRLQYNQRNRVLIEEDTRGGKSNSRWHQIRQDLLPSSFIPKIVLAKQKRSFKNHLEELMYKRSEFGNNAAIKHQRLVERDALNEFQKLFNEFQPTDCGIFIDKELHFLCSSPFKLYGPDHVLNIKCPLKQYNANFENAVKKLPFWDHGSLNRKHEWLLSVY